MVVVQGKGLQVYRNPRAWRGGTASPAEFEGVLNAGEAAEARAEIGSWPGYAATPLAEFGGLSRALGVASVRYKDESGRFGLKSFKALGGAYAVLRQVQARVAKVAATRPSAKELLDGRHHDIAQTITVTCATDGNHGRSVAWGARLFGCRCVIFIHAGVSEGRREAIAAYGAEVIRVAGNYDDSVRHAAEQAASHGWIVVSDTSYEGYVDIPRDVMHGYTVIADEIIEQIADAPKPTHAFVQAGVGGLAAAICARFWQRWGAERPMFVVVEPEKADCNFQSARTGRPAGATGDLDTIMAGLSCGEVSPLAWQVLERGADAFITISDEWALDGVRLLAEGRHGDRPLVAGETGVAGLAGLCAVARHPAARAALDLGEASRVLCIGSEGDTDPAIYRKIVGRSADDVRAQ